MEQKSKCEMLIKEIENSIDYFTGKHKKTKKKAYILRISTVAFGAIITTLLGLNIGSLGNLFKNTALILSAFVTIFNAVDGFYDYSALWAKSAVTLVKLQELRVKVMFYVSGRKTEEIENNKVERYMEQFHHILRDDLREWLRIREKVSSREEKREEDSPGK
jgi:hypothetical protein